MRWPRCKSVGNAGSKAKVGTFDTNAALVDAIKDGDVQWAVDQQPFLQGYLAVDSLWLYMNNKNVIGGGQADVDRPVVHRQDEHRLGGRAGQVRNPLSRRREESEDMTTQADLDLASHKVVHDERVKERNRVQRLLIRPEMGALIGAVAIFIFFAIVAPPFRSPEALATVLYASSTIGIMAVRGRRC